MDKERARDTSSERESESESEELESEEIERAPKWESGSERVGMEKAGLLKFWKSKTFHTDLKNYYFLPPQRCQLEVWHVWVST